MIALVNGQGTVIQQQEFVSVHSEGFFVGYWAKEFVIHYN